ncbi:MAG TPA: sugar-binding domain-containing protein [Clostridiaceae bacterium]
MEEILRLQKKIIPELIDLLEKRYTILRTIYYNQPIGRRILANDLKIGERIVRTEINFLKNQNLIDIGVSGMVLTSEGEVVIVKLKDFIHEIRGLSHTEEYIKTQLGLREVIVVPGNIDEDITVLSEIGRAAANYIKGIIKDNDIISLTGGTTIREVVDNMPRLLNCKNSLVVPARGGIGRNVEIQANTLAANLAKKIGGSYKLLHVPDNISRDTLEIILKEKDIIDVMESIHNANILIYGIGRADEMGRRRRLSEEDLALMGAQGVVAEAFGYYFDRNGEIVNTRPTIGINAEDAKKIDTLIAVAAGKNKAEAIVAIKINNQRSVLITDESAAKEMVNILKQKSL